MTRHTGFRVVFPPPAQMSWLQRAGAVLAVATLAVLAFFFLTLALVAGAILAAVILARLWWLKRKLQRAAKDGVYEGEYVVIKSAPESSRSSPPNA